MTDENAKKVIGRIYMATTCATDWKRGLAEPDKQWKEGYSAHALATCWEAAKGFPVEVRRIFENTMVPGFKNVEFLAAFPEYQVDLPPAGGRPSQNDLFILAKGGNGELMAIMVEGKWDEAFGPTVGEWKTNISPGKKQRLQFIQSELGLTGDLPSELRYQLLHRATSAVLEAKRFNARSAVMLVHSFSPENRWLDDYVNFVRLFQKQAGMNELISLGSVHGIALYVAWVKGVMPAVSSASSST